MDIKDITNKVLLMTAMLVILMSPINANAEPPPQCPCNMTILIHKLADMISKGSPDHDQQITACEILVDTNSPGSGERLEGGSFGNMFLREDSVIDGAYYSIDYYSIGYLPDEPTNGRCTSVTIENGNETVFDELMDEAHYEACKDEWLHIVNMYNAERTGKKCTREAINSFRNEQAVDFTAP